MQAMVVGVLCTLATAADEAPVSAVPEVVTATGHPLERPATAERTDEQALDPADDGRGTDYIVDKSDNICGLDNPRQLTNPAHVDYDALLDATPEIKTLKREKIPEDSARGIQLRSAAETRVRKACEKIMNDKGNCSVWKAIKRRDGQKLPDITDKVKDEL